MSLAATYPYYLANRPVQANTDLVVTNKYTNQPACRVAMADAELAPLLERLLDGPDADAVVILTSDHGEGLGDHGELTHGLFAYEATLRVPLILCDLRNPAGGTRVDDPVDLLDVPTTLLALALAFWASASAGQGSDTDPLPAPPRAEGEGPFERLVISNATLIDGSGAPAGGPVNIVIEGNRIAAVVATDPAHRRGALPTRSRARVWPEERA